MSQPNPDRCTGCRKDFSLDELHKLGKKLEPYLKKEAKKRKAQAPGKPRGKKKPVSSGNLPEENVGESRDQIGSAIGISGKQRQAKTIAEVIATPHGATTGD
jgi:hypothetical protein